MPYKGTLLFTVTPNCLSIGEPESISARYTVFRSESRDFSRDFQRAGPSAAERWKRRSFRASGVALRCVAILARIRCAPPATRRTRRAGTDTLFAITRDAFYSAAKRGTKIERATTRETEQPASGSGSLLHVTIRNYSGVRSGAVLCRCRGVGGGGWWSRVVDNPCTSYVRGYAVPANGITRSGARRYRAARCGLCLLRRCTSYSPVSRADVDNYFPPIRRHIRVAAFLTSQDIPLSRKEKIENERTRGCGRSDKRTRPPARRY